jgi:hypothetical protein
MVNILHVPVHYDSFKFLKTLRLGSDIICIANVGHLYWQLNTNVVKMKKNQLLWFLSSPK